jgi:hypothetical protein
VTADRAASIRARLLNQAKARGEEFNLVLTRYAIERFLYRLSLSPARDRLWLKGALLFDLWFGVSHRPTRVADFLGFGEMNAQLLATALREVCRVVADDGMTFDPDSIATEEIREEARYGGLRVKLLGHLGTARCHLQLDVGYGDAVTPPAPAPQGLSKGDRGGREAGGNREPGHGQQPHEGLLRSPSAGGGGPG